MTASRDPDLILAAWLDEGPNRLPDGTRRAIAVATRNSRQDRPRKWVPWRISMQLITKVALAAVTVAVLGRFGPGLFGSVATPGSAPSPSPSSSPGASPSTPIDTSEWTDYVSDRYGFSIGHPVDWVEVPAAHTWNLTTDADWLSPAQERFQAPDSSIGVGSWSVPVEPGTTTDAWIAAYCPLNKTAPCPPPADRIVAVTMDGHPGSLVRFDGDTQAFILVGDRMYVVAVWRAEFRPENGALWWCHAAAGGVSVDHAHAARWPCDRHLGVDELRLGSIRFQHRSPGRLGRVAG